MPGHLLDNLSVASPCKVSWDKMVGDEHVRFCLECKQNVYNVSMMTVAQAEELLAPAMEGRADICVQIFRRRDGTVLTSDCPVGQRAFQRRIIAVRAMGASVLAFFMWCIVMGDVAGGRKAAGERVRDTEPFGSIVRWLERPPVQPSDQGREGGKVADTCSQTRYP